MNDTPQGSPDGHGEGDKVLAPLFRVLRPEHAPLLLGGLAAFLTVIAVVRFGGDPAAHIRPVLYVIGIGFLVVLISAIIRNRRIMSVLAWFLSLLLIVWVIAYASYLAATDYERLACSVFIFSACEETVDDIVEKEEGPTDAKAKKPPASATAPLPKAPAAAAEYIVYLQFNGSILRGDIVALSTRLKGAGWKVQGEERVKKPRKGDPPYRDVRYLSTDNNRPIAQALADSLNKALAESENLAPIATPPVKPVAASVKTKTLEIWINK